MRFMKGFPGVWWTTLDEVARHCEGLVGGGKLAIKRSPPPEPVKFD